MAGAGIAETSTGDNELFSEEELNDEAFENMVGGSFRIPNSSSATAAAAAQQEEEDYDNMDDELEHLAKAEEVLRQELDSIHVVAASGVTSPRLSSAGVLDEEIGEGGNEDDHDSIEEIDADDDFSIKEEEKVEHDDRWKDKNNTMDFSSILPEVKIDTSKENTEATTHHQQRQGEPRSNDRPTGNRDILRSQLSEHQLAELKSLIIEEFRREMDAAPPRPQGHDYKDESVTGARHSATPVSSSGIDEFSEEEEAQTMDHDDRRNDKGKSMDFSSILPIGDPVDTFSDDEEEVAELKSLLFPETLKREVDAAPPQSQNHVYKDETGTGSPQSETPASADIDTFSDEEPAQNAVSWENSGAHPSETPLSPKRDVLMSQFSEDQLAELKSLLFPEELRREMDASPPRAQDEAVTGARQSETPVSSSGINAFSDEEEAQNCVSRENPQAEDGIFEPMKDIFSLMFICNIKSLGFAYSVFFFALQVAILVLIAINVLLDAPDGNPLNVPVGTRLDVIVGQVLALFVSLITQSDFLATFDLINVKYDATVLSLFEGATRTKWIVSNICRFLVGVLSIAISFILIVQSTKVIDLFFNFAAVQFVSDLDNIAFQLAYRGYMVIGDLEETTRKLIHHVQFRLRKMVGFPRTKRRIP
eukprot:scaffold346263_cov24-Attheya_sp.AAC.1